MRGMRTRVLQQLIKDFFDQRNDIGWAYSQFFHLLHAHRHAAHLLGDHSPATGQGKQTHASIQIKKKERKQERK